jgi:hypothetical protein
MSDKKITLDKLVPDHNNQVYFDNDLGKFYIIIWDSGYYDTPYRFYIEFDGKTFKINPEPVVGV